MLLQNSALLINGHHLFAKRCKDLLQSYFPRGKKRRMQYMRKISYYCIEIFSHETAVTMCKAGGEVTAVSRRRHPKKSCVQIQCVIIAFIFLVCSNYPNAVQGQKIDCSSGFLCDFFSKFPHLPFTRLNSNNAGYLRTLDYMITKESCLKLLIKITQQRSDLL